MVISHESQWRLQTTTFCVSDWFPFTRHRHRWRKFPNNLFHTLSLRGNLILQTFAFWVKFLSLSKKKQRTYIIISKEYGYINPYCCFSFDLVEYYMSQCCIKYLTLYNSATSATCKCVYLLSYKD